MILLTLTVNFYHMGSLTTDRSNIKSLPVLTSLIMTLPIWWPYFLMEYWGSLKQPHFATPIYKILASAVNVLAA